MSKVNGLLDGMSHRDLLDLKQRIDAAIVARRDADKAELRQKIEALAQQHGLSGRDLVGKHRPRQPRRPAAAASAVVYRNPKNPAQTWSGRGRHPGWITAALATGIRIDSLLA